MKIYFYERLDSDDCFKEIPDFTGNYVIDFFSKPLPPLKSDSRYFSYDCDAYRFIGVASSEHEFLHWLMILIPGMTESMHTIFSKMFGVDIKKNSNGNLALIVE